MPADHRDRLVYRDHHHLTATFVISIAADLAAAFAAPSRDAGHLGGRRSPSPCWPRSWRPVRPSPDQPPSPRGRRRRSSRSRRPLASPIVSPSSDPAAGPPPTPQPSPARRHPARVLHERRVGPAPKSVADRAWEPVVATHPTDPRRIAVVYEHRGPGAGCWINPMIRISRDGGRTWRSTKRSPPWLASRRGMASMPHRMGTRSSRRDPPLLGEHDDAQMRRRPLQPVDLLQRRRGRTWSRLRVERATPPWVGGFPEIAVDRDPHSPNHGTVYVGYNWLVAGRTALDSTSWRPRTSAGRGVGSRSARHVG